LNSQDKKSITDKIRRDRRGASLPTHLAAGLRVSAEAAHREAPQNVGDDRSARIFIAYDLSNTVGLVTGPKQQQIIAAQGGANGPLLTWSNLYAHLAKAQVDMQVAKAKAAAELEMIQTQTAPPQLA
jgi:hypothetical protein